MRTTFMFLSILMCAGLRLFAQEQTEYGNFLQKDTAIKWAAVYHSVLDLTPVNPNYSINKFYLRKLRTGSVSTYEQDSLSFSVKKKIQNNTQYSNSMESMPYSEVKMNWKYYFSPVTDVSESIFETEQSACEKCFASNQFSFVEVKQLLFYKNHELFVRNVFLKPVFYAKKGADRREDTKYFSGEPVAFNAVNTAQPVLPVTATFIARTSNLINFSPNMADPDHKVLTSHNQRLSFQLFQDIKAGYIHAFDTERSLWPPYNFIRKDSLEFYHALLYDVPIYDSYGNLESTKKMMSEINFDSLYKFQLIQDIYFDFTKEKLYSKVIAIIPLIEVYTSAGVDLGSTFYWGVDFRRKSRPKLKKR